MAARYYPMVVDQGSDYRIQIPVLNANMVPVTVEGWQPRGQIRGDYRSTTILQTINVTTSGTSVIAYIPAAQSDAWTFRTGRYDIEIVAPDGFVTRLIEGPVIVRPEITR